MEVHRRAGYGEAASHAAQHEWQGAPEDSNHSLHSHKSKTDRIQNGPALICFASWSCIGLVRTHKRLGRPLTLPLLINDLAGPSPQYSEGDDELVTYIKRQASPMTPDSPQQILQMQQMRHEFTGKLVPRMTENC